MTKSYFRSVSPSEAELIRQPVVMQILPALNVGGVERGTIEVARAIIEAGGKAVVVSSGGQLVPQLQRIGAEHITLPVHIKNPLKWGGIRRELRKVMIAHHVDIVHVRSRAPAWIGLPVAKSLKLKTVSTIHGKFRATNFIKRFYNQKMLQADHVIAISDYVKSLIQKHYPKMAVDEKLSVIHRGVDVGYFNPSLVKQGRIINEATRLALPDDRPVVMMPARPTAWKGHEILLQAAAKIPQKNFTLVLLGIADAKAKFYDSIELQVKRLGLESTVRLAEKSTDVPAAMMLADVIVMPSIEPEPFGRVAIEAQAMGRPVVAFDHGGATESIADGETGFLAEPHNVDSLADKITQALSLGPRQRKNFALKAIQHIEGEFTITKMCDNTIAIYETLLQSSEMNR